MNCKAIITWEYYEGDDGIWTLGLLVYFFSAVCFAVTNENEKE